MSYLTTENIYIYYRQEQNTFNQLVSQNCSLVKQNKLIKILFFCLQKILTLRYVIKC